MSIFAREDVFAKSLSSKFQGLVELLANCVELGVRVDEAEKMLWEGLRDVGRTALQQFVAAAGDGDRGAKLEHEGRVLRRSTERHGRQYRSVFGPIEIGRYVYTQRLKSKVEFSPVDVQLGLPAGEESYVLETWAGRLATHLPYGAAVDALHEILGTGPQVRTVEQMVRTLASYVPDFRLQRPPLAAPPPEEILAVVADGKGVPIRRPLEQRLQDELGQRPHKRTCTTPYQKAEKRRTRGAKRVGKQMASVGSVYRVARWVRSADEFMQPESPEARPRPGDKRLWAEMTEIQADQASRGADRLFAQLKQDVQARLGRRQRTVVCLLDGDRSLWKLKAEYLPEAIGILDIYHVQEKLWQAAYCFYPEGSADAEGFAQRYLKMLLEGKVGSVLGVFRRWHKYERLSLVKRRQLGEVITYFDRYRFAMRYDEYLKQGYPIGSGVAEGACRHVVADRLEQTGMRWELEGAQAMLDLRTTVLNDEWLQFMDYRIQTEQAALYRSSA